ncbi:MAG: aminotransferase class V-fold PLP-dependent enzyme [Candidatus Pacebacteria bacterium]|nr:aminotransferase class V-fold PLP-dependent enzyme [Candidatus Paceibacterota bacterium]
MNNTKQDFPIFNQNASNKPLVYLDSAATSQKPESVIKAIADYYRDNNANIGRGVYQLAEKSTTIFDQSHQKIAQFFGALNEEFIATPNTTAAINGVAYGWADYQLKPGETIVSTLMEHHSNLVVWQEACQRNQTNLVFLELNETGELNLDQLVGFLKQDSVKLLTLTHVSNVLGSIAVLEKISQLVKKHSPETRILVDAAQSAPHLPIDFSQLNVDFMAFSGHKMLGPMGSGGLLVKKALLDSGEMQPWLFGGGMIDQVTVQKTEFNQDLVHRFTAGTPDVAGLVGLAQACAYLDQIGMEQVKIHDQELVAYGLELLSQRDELKIVGPADPEKRSGSISFIHRQFDAHDVARVLDSQGVAVRSGFHCCHPLHHYFNWQATIRASFNVYTTKQDLDALDQALDEVSRVLQ